MKHSTPIPTTKREIKAQLESMGFKFTTLFASPLGNPKVKKSAEKAGVLTFPLHLAPALLSGFQTCASASEACILACLHAAGNPASYDAKTQARIARTQAFFRARPLFLALLAIEMRAGAKKAKRMNFDLAYRLNATSDIRWESVRFPRELPDCGGLTVIEYAIKLGATPYDYTKHTNRRNYPAEYSLTYSWAGDNESQCIEAFESGLNVAIAFDVKRGKALPKAFNLGGHIVPIHDADDHDARFLDPQGTIAGLRYKYDTSAGKEHRAQARLDAIAGGFVIACDDSRVVW